MAASCIMSARLFENSKLMRIIDSQVHICAGSEQIGVRRAVCVVVHEFSRSREAVIARRTDGRVSDLLFSFI